MFDNTNSCQTTYILKYNNFVTFVILDNNELPIQLDKFKILRILFINLITVLKHTKRLKWQREKLSIVSCIKIRKSSDLGVHKKTHDL